ncbi:MULTISPECIES: glycosyltransferase family 4 protein [unclassified Knoellia]|uniref:glycosyltransferase family 4 protein n=1 Tax=Knoellia altitudinis TaxID=3404795 RepID=UPI003606FCF2
MTHLTGRVVHITTVHRSTDNRIFRKECRALHEAGIDVHLVASHDGADVVDGIPIHRLPRRSSRLARMAGGPIATWGHLRRLRPALVHAHDPELIPLLLAWKLRHPSTTVVFDAHESLPSQVMGKPYIPVRARRGVAAATRALERLAGMGVDRVVVATPSIRTEFPSAKTVLVQNYPWLSDFPEATPAPRRRRLVYVGGSSHERGLQQMLDLVLALDGTAVLVLAGPVTAAGQGLLDEHPATTRGLVENHGMRPAEDVPGLIAGGDVGIVLFHPLPNHYECQPTKMFEYMAAGRPFIASHFPAWQEMYGEDDCALFVDPLDDAAILEAARTLLDDPNRCERLGKNGRAALERRFTFDGESDRLVGMVRDSV